MTKLKQLSLVITTSLLLGACSYLAPIEEGVDGSFGLTPEDWNANGRFIYESGEERKTGQFDWRQQGGQYEVRLFGPFGIGSIKITGDASEVEIVSSEDTYTSNQPSQLFYELTNMQIPISELGNWLVGNTEATNQDSNGWHTAYDEFESVESYNLPTRIDIANENTSIRIAISDWSLDLAD